MLKFEIYIHANSTQNISPIHKNISIFLYYIQEIVFLKQYPNGINFPTATLINKSTALWGPVYLHGLTLITAWISNHMPSKVLVEMTYPFLDYNN